MNRREFAKLTALTSAGIALVGPSIFAKESKAFKGWQTLPMLHTPINEGPAPLWEDFKFIFNKVPVTPRRDGHYDIGWHAWWQGLEYGDYVCGEDFIEPIVSDPILGDIQLLLKEQADQTRHQLIKDAGIACYCTMCKVWCIVHAEPSDKNSKTCYFYGGKGLEGEICGVVSKSAESAEKSFNDMVMKSVGPTHGY
jgi:hypothetical protein